MRNLLRKELSELLNKQMLISLVVSFFIIMMLGTMMTSILGEEMTDSGTVRLIDQDQSSFSQQIIDKLEEDGYTVETGSDFEQMADTDGWKEAVVLPAGMEAAFAAHETVKLPTYTALRTTSTFSMMSSGSSEEAVQAAIEELLADTYIGDDLSFLKEPVDVEPYTYANGKVVQASGMAIVTSLAMFDQVMPLVLFLLVVLTAQTIITAIASEKMDKTLETLLSSPVSRTKILGAKMLAALIVAVIYALVYGVGFLSSMMFGVEQINVGETSINVSEALTNMAEVRNAVQELGLQIPAYAWLGVAAQLVLTLAIALTAAIILGAMVEDAKNSQTASLPIMLCTMFPYILSMVSDIRNMEGAPKMLMMAIPFTHTFIATGCLRFHDMVLFWGGMAYQAVFLGVLVWVALRIYSSDILFVRSRKYRKKNDEA